eukprot:g7200.t1
MFALTLVAVLLLLLSPTLASEPVVGESVVLCSICDLIVELAEDFITDATTIQDVDQWLEGVCRMLPTFMERECDKFIEAKIDSLAEALLTNLPADVICYDMGACGEPELGGWSIWCDVCETIMVDV